MIYWEPNRLVSNSMMEGLIFKEMIEHPHVCKARELGEIKVVDEDRHDGMRKAICIFAYFDDAGKDAWDKFIFIERLNGNID